jgi:chromosome segregation ATPase
MFSTRVFMKPVVAATAMFVAVAWCSPAWSDPDKSKADARRIQLMQQRFQEEKSALEAEKVVLRKKAADLELEVARLRADQRKNGDLARSLGASKDELAKAGEDLKQQMADAKTESDAALAAKQRDLARLASQSAQERTDLQSSMASQSRALGACENKNERLVQVGAEILGRYRSKGLMEGLSQQEPVLQLGDVEMFNLVQDYRDKIDAERIAPAARNTRP